MNIPHKVVREGKKATKKVKEYADSEGLPIEEKIHIIANTKYCRHWAAGMCSFAGFKEGTKEYEECVKRLSIKLAERLV